MKHWYLITLRGKLSEWWLEQYLDDGDAEGMRQDGFRVQMMGVEVHALPEWWWRWLKLPPDWWLVVEPLFLMFKVR